MWAQISAIGVRPFSNLCRPFKRSSVRTAGFVLAVTQEDMQRECNVGTKSPERSTGPAYSVGKSQFGNILDLPGSGRRFEQQPARVEAITVDDYIAAKGFDIVDDMKVDVEGHEMAVIRGAQRAIEKGVIKAISFEFGHADISSQRTFGE